MRAILTLPSDEARGIVNKSLSIAYKKGQKIESALTDDLLDASENSKAINDSMESKGFIVFWVKVSLHEKLQNTEGNTKLQRC